MEVLGWRGCVRGWVVGGEDACRVCGLGFIRVGVLWSAPTCTSANLFVPTFLVVGWVNFYESDYAGI